MPVLSISSIQTGTSMTWCSSGVSLHQYSWQLSFDSGIPWASVLVHQSIAFVWESRPFICFRSTPCHTWLACPVSFLTNGLPLACIFCWVRWHMYWWLIECFEGQLDVESKFVCGTNIFYDLHSGLGAHACQCPHINAVIHKFVQLFTLPFECTQCGAGFLYSPVSTMFPSLVPTFTCGCSHRWLSVFLVFHVNQSRS